MTGSGDSIAQVGADPLAKLALDPYSGEQLYRQLYRALRAAILSGAWGEGEIIPSENEMRDRFAIARTTVRNAMALLVREGLVSQVRGRGTMVSHRPVSHSVWNFGSFTDLARANGKRPVTRVLEHRIEDEVLVLVRARGLGGAGQVEWLNLDTSWLPLDLYPGIESYDFAAQSLYAVLRQDYGRDPMRSEIHLSVVPPTPQLVEVFGAEPAVPGYLCASGDVIDAAGERVERTSIIYSPRVEMKFATRWGHGATGSPRPKET
jgi:GntR family transcriptional regulator